MPIVITSSPGTKPNDFAFLKARVAKVVGGQNDATALSDAGDYLNAAIHTFNSKLYDCNKTKSTTITCTNGTGTLPSDFYKEIECRLTNSAGAKIASLDYRDWAEYHGTFTTSASASGTTTSGIAYYTLFNVHALGQVELLPTPTGTNYVQFTYYRRFADLVGDSNCLDAPREIEEALVLHAQATMLREQHPESKVLGITEAKAQAAWDAFAIIDRKHENNHARLRLPGRISVSTTDPLF